MNVITCDNVKSKNFKFSPRVLLADIRAPEACEESKPCG